jgi:hypothetical protein
MRVARRIRVGGSGRGPRVRLNAVPRFADTAKRNVGETHDSEKVSVGRRRSTRRSNVPHGRVERKVRTFCAEACATVRTMRTTGGRCVNARRAVRPGRDPRSRERRQGQWPEARRPSARGLAGANFYAQCGGGLASLHASIGDCADAGSDASAPDARTLMDTASADVERHPPT